MVTLFCDSLQDGHHADVEERPVDSVTKTTPSISITSLLTVNYDFLSASERPFEVLAVSNSPVLRGLSFLSTKPSAENQLINVSDGYHLWSERYDRDMGDVFEVQDEITQSVVEKLRVKLLGVTDEPLVKRPTENLEAYNLVLKGRYYYSRLSRTSFERGRECFSQALALEPD